MKIKSKVKTSDVSTGAVQVGGVVAGFMATNGIANVIAKVDDEALITDEQKKTKLYVAVGSALVGGLAAVFIEGTDAISKGAQAVGLGLAAGGVKGIVQHVAKDKVATLPAGTPTARLVSGALGCPCETPVATFPSYRALAMPSSLRNPAFIQAQMPEAAIKTHPFE